MPKPTKGIGTKDSQVVKNFSEHTAQRAAAHADTMKKVEVAKDAEAYGGTWKDAKQKQAARSGTYLTRREYVQKHNAAVKAAKDSGFATSRIKGYSERMKTGRDSSLGDSLEKRAFNTSVRKERRAERVENELKKRQERQLRVHENRVKRLAEAYEKNVHK